MFLFYFYRACTFLSDFCSYLAVGFSEFAVAIQVSLEMISPRRIVEQVDSSRVTRRGDMYSVLLSDASVILVYILNLSTINCAHTLFVDYKDVFVLVLFRNIRWNLHLEKKIAMLKYL